MAQRLLIYRLGSLGDTIVALPALHLIARTFPDAERWMLTNFNTHSKAAPMASVAGGHWAGPWIHRVSGRSAQRIGSACAAQTLACSECGFVAAECAEQCMALLADEPRRKAIAAAGHARALRNGHYNEQVMRQIIDCALALPRSERTG